ncbi:hypothetical protein NDU88_005204 [Pleurodeles waltl]|uniref:Uncharacterized protein n=1 Tax=Pleurodeles waltl TaxID=8319 RepID=A0AAV7MYK4_PLEWA|nr:hypothetical protein NDU88_005204 [Pleurodeles waltl]
MAKLIVLIGEAPKRGREQLRSAIFSKVKRLQYRKSSSTPSILGRACGERQGQAERQPRRGTRAWQVGTLFNSRGDWFPVCSGSFYHSAGSAVPFHK